MADLGGLPEDSALDEPEEHDDLRFANGANKELHASACKGEGSHQIDTELADTKERIEVMNGHLASVKTEQLHAQRLVDAKIKEIETEDHLSSWRRRARPLPRRVQEADCRDQRAGTPFLDGLVSNGRWRRGKGGGQPCAAQVSPRHAGEERRGAGGARAVGVVAHGGRGMRGRVSTPPPPQIYQGGRVQDEGP